MERPLTPAEFRRRSTAWRQVHHAVTGVWLSRSVTDAMVRTMEGMPTSERPVRGNAHASWKAQVLARVPQVAPDELPPSGLSRSLVRYLTWLAQEGTPLAFREALTSYQADLDEVAAAIRARPGAWPMQREWEAATWRRLEWDPALTQWMKAAVQDPSGDVMAALRPHIPDEDLGRWVRLAVIHGEAAPLKVLLPWVSAAKWDSDWLRDAVVHDHLAVLQALVAGGPLLEEDDWVDLTARAFMEVSSAVAHWLLSRAPEARVIERLRANAGPHVEEAWSLWDHLAEVRAETPDRED